MLEQVMSVAQRVRIPMPSRLRKRVDNYVRWKLSQRLLRDIFARCVLIADSPGLWRVEPMPEAAVLDRFYQLAYWPTRLDKDRILRDRDVGQFLHLQEFLQRIEGGSHQKKALNFGSGHGGISYLLMANGFQVTNLDVVDPRIPTCNFVQTLDVIQEPFDLVYSSHSLEHVRDAKEVVRSFDKILKPGGLIYLEVPNSFNYLSREDVDFSHALHPPHTFYFVPDFFRLLPYRILDLDTYIYSGNPYGRATKADRGEVIRVILQRQARPVLPDDFLGTLSKSVDSFES